MLAGASNWKPDAARLADHCARASCRQPELQTQLCNIRLHLVGVVDARIAGAAVGALERGSARKLVVSRLHSEKVHLVTEAQSVESACCIVILPQSVTSQIGTLRRMLLQVLRLHLEHAAGIRLSSEEINVCNIPRRMPTDPTCVWSGLVHASCGKQPLSLKQIA